MPTLKASHMTKRGVDALQPGETIWDDEARGFACRCQRQRKIFVLRFRAKGRQQWLTIGEYGAPWTVQTARAEAQRLLSEIRSGTPVDALRTTRSGDPTIADLCERYLEEHAFENKRASSARMDAANIANHIRPLLGRLYVKDVTRSDIEHFRKAIRAGRTAKKDAAANLSYKGGAIVTGGPGVANRCLALLSKMFNLAEIWGWRGEYTNPCRLVAKYPENQRQRFLSDDEVRTLGKVLDECAQDGSESPYVITSIRLLLLTGARLGEILTAQWKSVDLDRGYLTVPDSKTGPKVIFLSPPALDVLRSLKRQPDNPFVIVGKRPGTHLVNLRKPWGRIRKLADLDDVRLHDLRHSFASIAASNGASLPLIGQLLGHTQPQTTQRYAHLAAKPVREVNDAVGDRLAQLMTVCQTTTSTESQSVPSMYQLKKSLGPRWK